MQPGWLPPRHPKGDDYLVALAQAIDDLILLQAPYPSSDLCLITGQPHGRFVRNIGKTHVPICSF